MATSRRKFLQVSGGMIAASSIGGCPFVSKPKVVCPFDPAFTDAESILAIDVHSHIFNATDLQVKDFVRLIAARQSGGLGKVAEFFGEVLQRVSWHTAPDVEEELEKLTELKPLIMACDNGEIVGELEDLRQKKYAGGKLELDTAAQERMLELAIGPTEAGGPTESLPIGSRGLGQVLALPDTYEEFFEPPREEEFLLEGFTESFSIKSALKFIIEMFQYRFVSVYNYLESYSKDSDIKIDLLAPAAVDYDWWLSKGAPTKSRLPKQLELMKVISILTGGRVHALVPFDPFRQVVHDLGDDSGFSPIDLVKTSVQEYGAIGIKLYPPMGFAPFGNQQVGANDPDMWKTRSWLSEVVERDDFPKRLDDSLEKLYDYCGTKDVPVMGHTNESNGPTDEFEQLTSPKYWEMAATGFENVSFSFGHFGGAGSAADDDESNAEGFLKIMASDQLAGKHQIGADASYFSNILEDPERLINALETIYKYGGDTSGPAMDRLMYGADWKMLVAESGSANYLKDFNRVMTDLEDKLGIPDLKEKFFGQNAAEFLGLRRNQENRKRLEKFYERNEVADTPVWMDKVDNQG